MTTYFEYEGQRLDVEDLDFEALVPIQALTETPWYKWLAYPPVEPKVCLPLARACAAQLGVTLPERISVRLAADLFVIDDKSTLPTEYEDGLPDPNQEGAPETSKSSGAPSDSDGPLT